MYMYVCICMYVYVYMYICIYVYVYSFEIENHGERPQIMFSSQGHIEVNIMQKNSSYKRKVQLISLFVFVLRPYIL